MSTEIDNTQDLTSIEDLLSGSNDTYNTTKASDGKAPDGKYVAMITNVTLKRAKTSGNPMIAYELTICGPEYKGSKLFKNSVILPNDKQSLGRIKYDLELLGLNLDKFSDLPNRSGELINAVIELTVRTNGDFKNIDFKKLLGYGEEAIPEDMNVDVLDDIPI